MPNPFDELGLKKEVVQYLRSSGKLGDFLTKYARVVQGFVHPDMGGKTDLSAKVNAAFSEIKSKPLDVDSWIASMQNGANKEYETVIEGLVGEVERLNKVELDYKKLQEQHAKLLAERAGGSSTFERRRAAPRGESPRADTFGSASTSFRAPPPHRPTSSPREEPRPSPSAVYAGYVLMPRATTYAEGVHELREACRTACIDDVRTRLSGSIAHPLFARPDGSTIYRPLTFKENIKARVENFNLANDKGRPRTMAERLFLMTESWLDSCTGAAYKAGTTLFKVIPACSQLITIGKDFRSAYFPVSYDSLEGEELDSEKHEGMFNTGLSKAQYTKNQGWRAALEGDRALQNEYGNIVYETLKERSADKKMPENAMGFFIRIKPTTDELRALCVLNLDGSSDANGSNNLSSGGRFLRVSPSS